MHPANRLLSLFGMRIARGVVVPLTEVTAEEGAWDVYCGCWTKAEPAG